MGMGKLFGGKMPSAIGLRSYQLAIRKRGEKGDLPFTSKALSVAPAEFFPRFIEAHKALTRNDEFERSWYFEPRDSNYFGRNFGHIHYGTFGYESKLKDGKTKS